MREIFRPKPETRFTVEGPDEMVLVRDSLLPVTRLHKSFASGGGAAELSDGVLVVAETAGQRFCLFVDQVLGKQEVVIKSLGETFKTSARRQRRGNTRRRPRRADPGPGYSPRSGGACLTPR